MQTNERTNPLSRSLFRSLSLSPSASGHDAPNPRTALSRASQVDEPSRLRSLSRGPRSTLVCQLPRLRAYYTRVCRFRTSRAFVVGAPRTHPLSQEKIYIAPLSLAYSLSLSLCVAHRRSRFAKPAPKVPSYRFHSLTSFLLSLFSDPVVLVSPLAPRGRCPTWLHSTPGETRRRRETNGKSTPATDPPTHRPTDQPIQPTNRTTLSTVHYRSTATSVH